MITASGTAPPHRPAALARAGTGRRARTEVKNLTLYFESDALVKWEGEYFPEQDEALAAEMRKFGNLPKEDKDKGTSGGAPGGQAPSPEDPTP